MKKDKLKKLIFLLGYVLLACVLVYFLKPDYFYSILIVLGPPSLLNYFWLKKSKSSILFFSLITTAIFAPPIELASRLANTWDVQSIFYRPFGYIPLENMLFAFFNFLWVLSFYKYFVDKATNLPKISQRFKYLFFLYTLLAFIVFMLYFYNKNIISLNYWLMSVPILIIPSLLIFYHKPKLIKKTILPTIFFALIFFVYELTSLLIGSWWWPGEYLWPITIFGHIFPLDDVIIWYFLSTPTLIGGYEIFMDDGK